LPIRRLVPALLAATMLVTGGAAHGQTLRNFTLESHRNDYPTPPVAQPYAYSACWSYIHQDGREYAILGVASGVAIYNVTNPAAAYQVGFFAGPPSIWRETKSYRNWIYVVTEGTGAGEGLQIIRMTNPEAPVLAATYTTNFVRSHTVSVDTARAVLICNGTRRANGTASGMRVLSIASPEAPVEIAKWPAAPDTVPVPQYVHDSVPVGNRLYAASVYAGTERVLDFTNPAAPAEIASWTYPRAFYTHNSWPDSSGNTLYVTDEQNGQELRVFDISNLGAPAVVNAITSNPQAIVHNVHVKGRELYASNYTEGIRVYDLSDPAHPAEYGWADSYPGPSGGYSGVWEVCPFFPSGTVIASDMQTGLYVYRPVRDYGLLRVRVVNGVGQALAGVRVSLTTQGDSLETPADGIVQFAPSPGTHTVLAHEFGYVDAAATRVVSVGSRDTIVLTLASRPTVNFTGTIRDSDTNALLEHAEVTLAYTTLHDHSDAAGVYSLTVPDDYYEVHVTRTGYVPITFVRRIGPGYPGTDFRLKAVRSLDALEVASGWTVGAAGDNATSGLWTRVAPNGTGNRPPTTASEPGVHHGPPAAPPPAPSALRRDEAVPLHSQHEGHTIVVAENVAPYADHTPAPGTLAFVTGQGTDTANVDQADVDGGRTSLTSPAYDMTGLAEPVIGYWRWFFSKYFGGTDQPDQNDWLAVLISNNNGSTWVPVDTTRGSRSHWEQQVVRVADYVTPTSQVRLRFVAADLGPGTTVEAGVDDVTTYDAASGPASVDTTGGRALRFRSPAPNPSAAEVLLRLDLPQTGEVRMDILDVSGRLVRRLHRGRAAAGTLTLAWNGADDRGRAVPSGVYFVRALAAGQETRTRLVRIR
jgi:choice-of-anchor B domain-containing protein